MHLSLVCQRMLIQQYDNKALVLEIITWISPLPSDGFKRLPMSSPDPLFPRPTVPDPMSVWTSSMKRIILPAMLSYQDKP